MFEAEVDRNFLDADVGLPQAALGVLDAEPVPELVRRGLEILAEKPDEMVRADVNRRRQYFQREWIREVTGMEQIHRHADALIDAEVPRMPDSFAGEDLGERCYPFAQKLLQAQVAAQIGTVVTEVPGAWGYVHYRGEDGPDLFIQGGCIRCLDH